MFDYFAPDDTATDAVEQKESIVPRCEFYDSFKADNRPITSVDWSPQHPELILASYASSEDVMSDKPDGLVLIWNQKNARKAGTCIHLSVRNFGRTIPPN
eukprot:TRINITY_DN14344_c0_g1_i1.p1 TRINITY_DN14344_c0_g1~~TRINITY_DN14344_c0_g1_i1.p1  ORF type:complete len:100 (+),score=11.97 TRINITY_DN14344_c0_g1_i1:115-414(+)